MVNSSAQWSPPLATSTHCLSWKPSSSLSPQKAALHTICPEVEKWFLLVPLFSERSSWEPSTDFPLGSQWPELPRMAHPTPVPAKNRVARIGRKTHLQGSAIPYSTRLPNLNKTGEAASGAPHSGVSGPSRPPCSVRCPQTQN